MENEFVNYSEAVDLKELGFDEECISVYITSNKEPYPMYRPYTLKEQSDQLLRPLYQQAFRWFRETHNIDSTVKELYKSTVKVGYYISIDQYKGFKYMSDFDEYYKTYEEAELECLKKLIAITS